MGIRDTIEALYDEHIGLEDEDTEGNTDNAVSAKSVEKDETSEPEEAPKEQEDPKEDVPEEKEQEIPTEEAQKEPENLYEEVLTPPSFNETERELFASVKDKKAKKLLTDFVARRDASFQQAIRKNLNTLNQKYSEVSSKYQALDNIEKEHKDILERSGITVADAAKNALAWDKAFAESPENALLELAEQYGISVQIQNSGRSPVQQDNSQYRALQQELSELKQAYQGITAKEQERAQANVLNEVSSFTQAKDETGNLKYPLIDYVALDMRDLLPLVRQQNPALSNFQALELAYDKAVWANPQTRQIIQSKSTPAQQKPAKKSTSLETKKHGSASSAPTAPKGRSFIEQKYNELFNE